MHACSRGVLLCCVFFSIVLVQSSIAPLLQVFFILITVSRDMIIYKNIDDFKPEDLKLIDDSWHEYYASRDGRIYRRLKNGRLKQLFGTIAGARGYRQVCINSRLMYVHRIIASLFLESPKCKAEWLEKHPERGNYKPIQVHHKDGDHENNAVENLAWAEHDDHRHMHKGKIHWSDEAKQNLSKAKKKAAARRRKLTNACKRWFND